MASIDQHTAGIRDSLNADVRPLSAVLLAAYAEGVRDAAFTHGWRPPVGMIDWSGSDWVLRRLGERELAWDYLTTPVALQPGESDVWVSLAGTLKLQGERDLADRAYASAFERESSNAEILWPPADNLRQAGRLTQAQTLYRQLAETDWQPRFRHLRTQAQWQIDKR